MLSLVPLEDDNELRITSIIAKGTGKKKYIPLLLISWSLLQVTAKAGIKTPSANIPNTHKNLNEIVTASRIQIPYIAIPNK